MKARHPLLTSLLLGFASVALGQTTPATLSLQAVLTNDSTGQPASGSVSLNVEILDASSSCVLYIETDTATADSQGMISVALGSGSSQAAASPLSSTNFRQIFSYLGIITSCLNGPTNVTVSSESRMVNFSTTGTFAGSPISLQSVPYAFNADNAANLGGISATSINNYISELTGGTDISSLNLHTHDQHNDGRYVQLSAANNLSGILTTSSNIDLSGSAELGVGTTTPGANLDIEETTPTLRIGGTGSSGNTTSLQFYGNNGATNTATISSQDNSNVLNFYTGGTQAMSISSSQNVSFNKSVVVTGTLELGQYAAGNSPGDEGNWTGPAAGTLLNGLNSLGTTAEGTLWMNSTNNVIKYWDGGQPQTIATVNAINNAVSSYLPLAGGTMTGSLLVGAAPVATTTAGLVSLGSGPFNGSSSGYFLGNSNGTVVAVNAASGYGGDLMNLEAAGNSIFDVNANGSLTVSGPYFWVTGGGTPSNPVWPKISLGDGQFGGDGTPNFSGSANGIELGINSSISFGGDLLDLQQGGNPRFVVQGGGNVGIGTLNPSTALQVAGVITPSADSAYTLGSSSLRFIAVYATNGTIQTSDARQKKDITDSDLGLDFINNLRPVSYHWKSGPDDNLHYGLIAQETEKVVNEAKTKAGNKPRLGEQIIISHDQKTDSYGMRYTELISPIIKAIQDLYGDLKALMARVTALEDKDIAADREIASVKAENAELKKENAKIKAYLCDKDPAADICK